MDDSNHSRSWINEQLNVTDGEPQKLFVKFGRIRIEQKELEDYFSQYGRITRVQFMRDGFGEPRGFAFFTFSEESAIDNIINTKPHALRGHPLEIDRANTKEAIVTPISHNHSQFKIFIGGLPKTVIKEQIVDYFAQSYGNTPLFQIQEISLPVDKSGKTKGFAFVTFSHEKAVDKILSHSTRIEICGKVCEVKRAELREGEVEKQSRQYTSQKSSKRPYSNDAISFGNTDFGSLQLLSSDSGKSGGLVSQSVNKMKKMASLSPNYFTAASANGFEGENTLAFNSTGVKRSARGWTEGENVSDFLDHQTLVRIGRLFIDNVSNALDFAGEAKAYKTISSLLMTTLYEIISNVKR